MSPSRSSAVDMETSVTDVSVVQLLRSLFDSHGAGVVPLSGERELPFLGEASTQNLHQNVAKLMKGGRP